MKKENYGIPTSLLQVLIYALALYVCVNGLGNMWALIGLTIAAFILGFSSNVKKTLVQADALILIFFGVNIVFEFIGSFFSFADSADMYGITLYARYMDVVNTVHRILDIAAYVIFGVLGIMALAKKDFFVASVHKAVDGFVPRPVYQQPVYNGQPQQFNGQPQQFNGQPQQFNGQPQQFYGQPQQFNGQPNPQPQQPYSGQPNGQPQQYNGQPQQPK